MKIIFHALLLLCTGPLLAAGNIEDNPDQTTSHTGVGSSEKEACAMAQSSASEDKRVAGPCTCEIRNKKNICYADSTKAGSRSAKARPSEVPPNPSQFIPQQAQECEALIKYRDAALTADMKKALRNFDEFKKVLILLDQLDKTIRFKEMKDDSRVLVELQILKTIGTAVKTFIPFAGAGAAVNVAAAGSRSFQAAILVAKTRSFSQAVLDHELKNYILKEWLGAANPQVKALNALVETADNIKETFETVEDTRNTLSIIEISSKSLRKQIITAEKKIKSKENEFLLINKARNEIALFCDETPMRPVKM